MDMDLSLKGAYKSAQNFKMVSCKGNVISNGLITNNPSRGEIHILLPETSHMQSIEMSQTHRAVHEEYCVFHKSNEI